MLTADMPCVYSCIGSLGALSVVLGFRMSLFRINGSPGENQPDSPLNRWHLANQLHSEWAPVGVGMALALAMRGTAQHNGLARNLIALFSLSRWVFAGAVIYCPKIQLMMPSMMTMYGTLAGMALLLLCPTACQQKTLHVR